MFGKQMLNISVINILQGDGPLIKCREDFSQFYIISFNSIF